jgi:hypothetical protein
MNEAARVDEKKMDFQAQRKEVLRWMILFRFPCFPRRILARSYIESSHKQLVTRRLECVPDSKWQNGHLEMLVFVAADV